MSRLRLKWDYGDIKPEALSRMIEEEYNNMTNNKFDEGFIRWIKWATESVLIPAVIFANSKVIGIAYVIAELCDRTFALPGSTSDKIKYHKKFQHVCRESLAVTDNPEAKKEIQKLYNQSIEECLKLEQRERRLGGMVFSGIDYKKIESADVNLGITNHNSAYQYSNIYEEYIISKIDNEERIASHLRSIIPVQEAKYRNLRTLNESTLGDKAKNRFNKIIAFIKNLLAKFAESISSFLLDNKDYLEKYKDIILKKQPKSDNKYSYTGDYKLGMQRCMNFQIEQFNYNKYSKLVGEEDAEKARIEIAKMIFENNEAFSYTSGDNLGDKAKEYFLAWEKGDQEGTFDDGKLNFTDMYNFCYHVSEITKIKTRDEKFIEDANKKILTEIENQIKEKQNKTENNGSGGEDDKPSGDKPKLKDSTEASAMSAKDELETLKRKYNSNKTEENKSEYNRKRAEIGNMYDLTDSGYDEITEKIGESYISALNKYRNKYLMEADGDKPSEDNNKPTNNLKITPANNAISAISKNNTNGDVDAKEGAKGAANSDKALSDIQTLGDRYLQVVRTVIAARCTALEQMARNFMEIIRAHVRSYVGNADDVSTDKSQQAGNTYQRDKKKEENKKEEEKPAEGGGT